MKGCASGPPVALDGLVALAARVSGLPIAFVRLEPADASPRVVGTGIPEWLDDPALAHRVRDAAGLVTIEDVAADRELAQGPLAGLGVRFVAAQALPDVAGSIPGMLCVADTRPRSPDGRRLERVRVLAEHVARLLAVPSRLASLSAGLPVGDTRAGDGIGELRGDQERGDLVLSPAARQLLGVDVERMSRDEAVELLLGDGGLEAERLGSLIASGQRPGPWQAPVAARDGRVRWLEFHLAIEPREGELPLIHAVLLDLTERRLLESLAEESSARETAQAELEHVQHRAEHLRLVEESHRQLQAIMDGAPSAIHVRDREGRYIFINRAASEFFGVPVEEMLGKRASDLPGLEGLDAISAADRRVLEHGETQQEEAEIRGPDGVRRHYTVQKFPLYSSDGAIYAVCAITTDIEERKAIDAERRRRAEQQVLIGTLAREVAVGVRGTDLAERATSAARVGLRGAVAAEVTPDPGAESVTTVAGAVTAPPRALELAGSAIDSGAAQRASDGTAVPIVGHAGPTGALVVLSGLPDDHDASDEHFLEEIARLLAIARSRDRTAALEAELGRSRRLESIGKLAGGVAHDFNNLLAVILNYASFVADGLRPDQDDLRDDIAEISSAAQRAAGLTHQLLLFGRESRSTRDSSHPNEVIDGLRERLGGLLATRVELDLSLDPAVQAVPMSGDETEQALLALVLNAREAIADEGAVRIGTRLEAEDVVIVVCDNGRGMASEVLERAFEPFFTTRPPGDISGLGLATVHGIVRRAGGRVDIDSAEGEGTCVRIRLPHVVHEQLQAEPPQPAPTRAATILVVDDQAPVREVARRILEAGGYRVVVARSPQDARAIIASGQERIDLLLTDVVMPGESGLDLAASLDQQPVLFMSGYADEVLDGGGPTPGRHMLEKPFSKQSLLEAVELALTAGAGPG